MCAGTQGRSDEEFRRFLIHERLDAMGQIARGIVHDINNTLVPIVLYSEALSEGESALSDKGRKYLSTIQQAARGIEQITERLRMFYRREDLSGEEAPISVGVLIGEVLDAARAEWDDGGPSAPIDATVDVEDSVGLLVGIESEIKTALGCLLRNAAEAMPDGGQLLVTARRRPPWLVMQVSDSGVGMTTEQRQRCLEPFYSTKDEKAAGFGLATVYGVMQRHAGEIEIDSEVGQGTAVRLLFPARG